MSEFEKRFNKTNKKIKVIIILSWYVIFEWFDHQGQKKKEK